MTSPNSDSNTSFPNNSAITMINDLNANYSTLILSIDTPLSQTKDLPIEIIPVIPVKPLSTASSSESLKCTTLIGSKTLSAASSLETLKEDIQSNYALEKLLTPISSTKSIPKPSWKKFFHAISLCGAASLAGFLFGYDTGTISGFLGLDAFKERFGELLVDGTYIIPPIRSGLFVSAVCMGGLFGGLSASYFGEKFGRTWSAMGYSVIYIAAIVQMLYAKAWLHYFFARIMMGIAIGSYTLIVPMLISESSPNFLREINVSLFQLFITLGILAGNIAVFKTHDYEDITSYTHPIYVALGVAATFFFVMLKMPESPRYLLAHKKIIRAKNSIARFMNMRPDDLYVIREVENIYMAVQEDKKAGNASWTELVTGKPRIFYRVFVGTMIQIFQLFSGANYFFYYGTLLFSQIGGSMDQFATPIILSGVNVACTLLGLVIVHKFSRRSVLITGALGMLISFVIFTILGTCFFHPDLLVEGTINQQSVNIGKAMIACACTFILFYASTWAPLSYVISAELFPQRVRSKAMSLGFSSNWILNIFVNLFTPFIVKKIGFSIGFIFSGCLLAATLFSFFCVHETKGLTLEQTDIMYASGVSAIESSMKTKREEFLARSSKSNV
ncbi:uncharacterized protein SAPINGB_P003428 [Magnusiomyces paraingens]|uniref:Major facilitator superfamily (MFS) profile domain-containing protein n=1 Tax=Magnusiomyces paraingens TaxID=2606893 RepID=A0A5E8BRN6_9ASCO|nr:uncharacterized protein SAPINGB_P003428 [Saprochaete ingens]VVT53149.1 unnamed protein product [Saprochaete ingens]